MAQPIVQLATDIYNAVKTANSIYPTNQHEAQLRIDNFLNANGYLNSLVSQVEVAHEIFNLDTKVMEHWMGLVDKEIRLVKAIIKSDRKRYKEL